jgi:5-methylcytosine-specific restriction endonuclease McrA
VPNRTCTVERCEEAFLAKGLCKHHYYTNRQYGDPTAGSARDLDRMKSGANTCIDCGAKMALRPGSGPQTLRCPACKTTHHANLLAARASRITPPLKVCAWAGCNEPTPKASPRGRAVKWCEPHRLETRRNATKASVRVKPIVPCSADECDNPTKARGLCSTHYNQQLPTRHAKVIVPCDGCGKACLKERRTQRYLTNHCGDPICAYYLKWGAWSVEYRSPVKATKDVAAVEETLDRECLWCGATFTRTHGMQTYCDVKCANRRKRAVRRGREFGATGTFTWADITMLWLKFERSCAYCSRETALPLIQAEHVTALSRGGANNLTNLLPSCGACNSDKRDLPLEEWAKDRARRNLPAVKTTWTRADARYLHLVQGSALKPALAS